MCARVCMRACVCVLSCLLPYCCIVFGGVLSGVVITSFWIVAFHLFVRLVLSVMFTLRLDVIVRSCSAA